LSINSRHADVNRTPDSPPRIRPVTIADRPLWSVMIPVYNAGHFLKETLESVLIQADTKDNMQIEVVDDCSTDIDVESLVAQIAPGRISYFRQPQNVGSLRNFEACINRATGKYIHLLHSDDLVHPGFYKKLGGLFTQYPAAAAAFCHYQYIDENGTVVLIPDKEANEEGILKNWLLRLAERQRIQYVAIAVKREVYEELGAFYGVHYGEDWEMWVRIAVKYPFAYTPAIYASYRRHYNSISGQSFTTAQNLKDLQFVMNRISHYLPANEQQKTLQKAKKFYAYYAFRTAGSLWKRFRDRKGALAQMREAWRMHQDIPIAWMTIKMIGKIIFNR
jgi:glycosyltransferase involved in cell wall biosynthesis